MRQQVGIPVAGPWWSPRDIQMPLDIVEPYLDATELPGFPSSGGNVDEVVMNQGVLHLLVHMQSPVRILFRLKASVPPIGAIGQPVIRMIMHQEPSQYIIFWGFRCLLSSATGISA